MAEYSNLRLKPTTYLGLDYNRYKNEMYKLCLTDSSKYYTLRSDLEETIYFQAIDGLYDSIHHALTKGMEKDGTTPLGLPMAPNLPQSVVNDVCMSACETLNSILQKEVMERLMPVDYEKMMNARLEEKGRAKNMGDV
jgi:hypothetical protein